VFAVNPVIELVNAPMPVPSVVLLFPVVGLADVVQQTPLAVIAAPPSLGMFPPLVPEVVVTADNEFVVKTGIEARALNVVELL
jgi:hypothetical protein